MIQSTRLVLCILFTLVMAPTLWADDGDILDRRRESGVSRALRL